MGPDPLIAVDSLAITIVLGAWKGGEGGESDGGDSDGGEGGERAGRFDANFSCFRATQERGVSQGTRGPDGRTSGRREARERVPAAWAERRESKSPIRSNIFRLDEAWTRAWTRLVLEIHKAKDS